MNTVAPDTTKYLLTVGVATLLARNGEMIIGAAARTAATNPYAAAVVVVAGLASYAAEWIVKSL